MKPKTIILGLALAAMMIATVGVAAKKANPFKAGGCLRCHHQMDTGKEDGIIMGNWINRSRKAKTLTVKIGPRIQILKWSKKTAVENAPSIHKLKKGLAVRIHYVRDAGALVAKKIVAKPKLKVPKKQLIGAKALYKLLKAGKVARLVDSRPPFRFVAGTLPGAINIPFPKMGKMLGKLPKDKNALIVFFCQGFR